MFICNKNKLYPTNIYIIKTHFYCHGLNIIRKYDVKNNFSHLIFLQQLRLRSYPIKNVIYIFMICPIGIYVFTTRMIVRNIADDRTERCGRSYSLLRTIVHNIAHNKIKREVRLSDREVRCID